MKKFLLIALAVAGLAIASTPSSEAGVSLGIGFGAPVGCYPYPCYYPYGYPYYGYRPYRVVYRPHHWYHGRRVYYARPYWCR